MLNNRSMICKYIFLISIAYESNADPYTCCTVTYDKFMMHLPNFTEIFHSSSDSEEELIPIALRILGIFLVMNFL